MIEDEGSTLRSVAWSEIFPWLNLFRTFRLAIEFRMLLLAAVAVLLMFSGWWVIDSLLPGPAEGGSPGCPFHAMASSVPDRLPLLGQPIQARSLDANPLATAWISLTSPLQQMLLLETSVGRAGVFALRGLLALAVWAFFGAAIVRIASVQLACEERLNWGAVLRHACSKWLSYFSAPLFPIIGLALLAVPIGLVGLLAHGGGFGIFLVALLWPLFLVCGLLMALLLLGLLFGWPLMWATIGTEGTDSFDALSRSYAYVFQRPLHYLFYVVVAGLFGCLCWLLVAYFAAAVIHLTFWAASWGGGQSVTAIADDSCTLGAGAALIRFWVGCVKWIAFSFVFSYFWTAATAIYYLLRRNVDATEMDEVALDEEEQGSPLPPLKTEGPDAPAVAEKPADQE